MRVVIHKPTGPTAMHGTIDLIHPNRPASPADDLALAELINFAGEGLPVYLWDRMREDGETVWDVGCRRARRDSGAFSWRNAVVAEVGGDTVAAVIGYALPDTPEPIDLAAMPAMFVPLQELENLACGTWYVNVLAAYPSWRGQGLGAGLLAAADRIARREGHKAMSIIVSDANKGARRLYERGGYRAVDSRPMVKDDWVNDGENWVLMIRAL